MEKAALNISTETILYPRSNEWIMLFRQQFNVFPQRSFLSAFLCEAFRRLVWCERSIAIVMLYWKAWNTNASWICCVCRWTCTRLHLFGMEFSLQVPLVENYRSHPHQNRSHYHRCVWYICFLCCYCLLMYKCCAFSFFVVRVPFCWQFQLWLLETAIDIHIWKAWNRKQAEKKYLSHKWE